MVPATPRALQARALATISLPTAAFEAQAQRMAKVFASSDLSIPATYLRGNFSDPFDCLSNRQKASAGARNSLTVFQLSYRVVEWGVPDGAQEYIMPACQPPPASSRSASRWRASGSGDSLAVTSYGHVLRRWQCRRNRVRHANGEMAEEALDEKSHKSSKLMPEHRSCRWRSAGDADPTAPSVGGYGRHCRFPMGIEASGIKNVTPAMDALGQFARLARSGDPPSSRRSY